MPTSIPTTEKPKAQSGALTAPAETAPMSVSAHTELFERWRSLAVGAAFCMYELGGTYDYWPRLEGPMCSEHPPFVNTPPVGDHDRMYHRIG